MCPKIALSCRHIKKKNRNLLYPFSVSYSYYSRFISHISIFNYVCVCVKFSIMNVSNSNCEFICACEYEGKKKNVE